MTELGRVRVEFSGWTGGPGIATHYVRKQGVSSWGFYHDSIVAAFRDAYLYVHQLMTTDMVIKVQGDMDIIEDTTGEILQTLTTDPLSQDGTVDGDLGPAAAGIVVTWRTNGVVAGKHVRGRTFLVPLAAEVNQGDGTVESTSLTLADGYATSLIGMLSGLVQPVVWSRPKLDRSTTPPEYVRYGSNHDIVSATVPDMFAILRSRRD